MLPTVGHVQAVRKSFAPRRVDARTRERSALSGGAQRAQTAEPMGAARSLSFLPLRVGKGAVEASGVQDDP